MRPNVPTIVAITGFSLLILGLLASSFIFPKLENYLIAKETAMVEGSQSFMMWQRIPFPFKFKIYFFNVTNPDEVEMGARPKLKEIGPYIYNEFRGRDIVSISDENDTIKYTQRKIYYFNQDESGCRSDDDVVTILHFAIVSMALKISKLSPMAVPMLNDALPYLYPGIKNAFITNSVRNILFDGLPMLCESEEVEMICDGLKAKLPHTIRLAENDRDLLLSLFNHLNGTLDGPYEIGRGLQSTVKGKVLSFKDQSVFTQWGGEQCNAIKGTDLTLNPNLLKIPKKMNIFVPDFCRYFSVKFVEKIDYLGLQTYLFKTQNLFNDERSCFCDKNDLQSCPPQGTMDITPCAGSPIVLSQPHFFNADKSLLEFARGLQPDRSKHETSIIIEPKTGLALLVKTRFQMNIFLRKYDEIGVLQNVTEGLFPFIWFENGAEIPPQMVEEIRKNFSKLGIFDVVKYILVIGGVLLLVVSMVLALIKDRIFCSIGRKNTIGDDRFGKIMAMYPELKMSGALVQKRENLAKQAWKIIE